MMDILKEITFSGHEYSAMIIDLFRSCLTQNFAKTIKM